MSEPAQVRDLLPPNALSDEHLLVALTGSSAVRDLACAWPLSELAGHTPAELRAAGFTPTAAKKVAATFELARRLATVRLVPGQGLRTSDEIFRAYEPQPRELRKERFLEVLLDARGRVIREEVVSEGIFTASLVHPREVFRTAIKWAASSVVLVHNHPSGDPEPSPEDHEITKRPAAVG